MREKIDSFVFISKIKNTMSLTLVTSEYLRDRFLKVASIIIEGAACSYGDIAEIDTKSIGDIIHGLIHDMYYMDSDEFGTMILGDIIATLKVMEFYLSFYDNETGICKVHELTMQILLQL
jgi:hypothetical protein